jgi:AraC family transcriptional regulator
MHAWESIQKSLDYIETNIRDEIDIDQLAKESSLSLFYYQRLFSRLVKKPVREYIKLRRLAHACKLLADKNTRILDVALDCGFGSHETFTRAFKEAYKITPEEYRKHPVMLNQFDKPNLLLNYTMIDEDVPLITDGLVVEFKRKTILQPILFMGVAGMVPIDGQMPLGEATGVDMPGEVWRKFHREKQSIPRIEGGRELGVAYLGDVPEGYFTYFAGAEVAQGTKGPRFAAWELPAREYIVCGFEAENFEQLVTVALNKAVKYSGLWLEKHDLIMDVYSPELYYDSSPDSTYMELWMPASKKY